MSGRGHTGTGEMWAPCPAWRWCVCQHVTISMHSFAHSSHQMHLSQGLPGWAALGHADELPMSRGSAPSSWESQAQTHNHPRVTHAAGGAPQRLWASRAGRAERAPALCPAGAATLAKELGKVGPRSAEGLRGGEEVKTRPCCHSTQLSPTPPLRELKLHGRSPRGPSNKLDEEDCGSGSHTLNPASPRGLHLLPPGGLGIPVGGPVLPSIKTRGLGPSPSSDPGGQALTLLPQTQAPSPLPSDPAPQAPPSDRSGRSLPSPAWDPEA